MLKEKGISTQLVILMITAVLLLTQCTSTTVEPTPTETPIPLPTSIFPVGPTDYCQAQPIFVKEANFANSAMSSSLAGYVGLALIEFDATNNPIQVYQLPSWSAAGYLGPITRDRDGHLYVAPVPKVSLEQNPLAEQNKIYRIDSITGEMSELIDLPAAKPLQPNNPFGTIGLSYDCDTHSLYISSLAGSSSAEEVGRIYRYDLTRNEVVDYIDGIDAIGIGIFNGFNGKKLYYGSARTSDIYSISLTDQGDFIGEAKLEFNLASLEGGGQEKARSINFNQALEMEIAAISFNFSLSDALEQQQIHYLFRYLPDDHWSLIQLER